MGSIAENPKIDGNRLWDNIQETAAFRYIAEIPGWMKRLSLSEYDKLVSNWFADKARDLGCDVRVDEMGNIFAIWNGAVKGEENKLKPIGLGSHLDIQPMGEFSFQIDMR
jgi:N-carbamoyl-L-amino-acid hydrolase